MTSRDIGNEILEGLHEIQESKKGNIQLITAELSEPSEARVIRAKLKLSQSAFADLLGISMHCRTGSKDGEIHKAQQ